MAWSFARGSRARPSESYTYVLLLTGRDHSDELIAGLEAGADDYVIKPGKPGVLRARLLVAERILRIHQQLLDSREEFRFAATHDALTSVWNRRHIMDCLRQELARGERMKSPVAVMVADLDHFKHVNDTLGHAAGDAVLCEVAARFGNTLRTYDAFGRIGGEEFLLVTPGCDEACAVQLAWRIIRAVSDRPVTWEGRQISVTVSIGVAATTAPAPECFDALLAAADAALYRAKERGRTRVEAAGDTVMSYQLTQ